MKTIRYIGFCITALLLTASCSDVVDYNDNVEDIFASDGAPQIYAIYDVQDTATAPTALNGGVLNQMIRINGKNLSYAKRITFNGIEVDLRQVYATSANCYLKIPRKIPENQTDTLVYETDRGQITKYFPVTIPHMVLEGLKNEFVKPGNRVQINSEYADLFGFGDSTSTASITFHNAGQGYSEVLKPDSISEEYFSIYIPKDAPDNSLITFKWTEVGGIEYTKTIPYRMTGSLMFDDMLNGDMGWWDANLALKYVTTGSNTGDPEYLGYPFFRFKKLSDEDGTFNSWNWFSIGCGTNWKWQDCTDHPENYVLKFEICTAASYPIPDYGANGANGSKNGGYLMSLHTNDNVQNCQLDFNTTYGLHNTYGKWVTISVPVSDLCQEPVKDATGTVVGYQCTLASEGAWQGFNIIIQPNTGENWNVDTSMANFRIEPKNY